MKGTCSNVLGTTVPTPGMQAVARVGEIPCMGSVLAKTSAFVGFEASPVVPRDMGIMT